VIFSARASPSRVTIPSAIALLVMSLSYAPGTAAQAGPDSTRAKARADSTHAKTRADSTRAKARRDSTRTKARPDSAHRKAARHRPAATKKPPRPPNADSLALAREDSILDSRWPVVGPTPLPGAILPGKRIVAYYGNPLSKRMGVLGEYEPEDMLRRLDAEVAAWTRADPSTPVQPALHLIAVVAQASPGKDGKYRLRMDSSLIEKVAGWAARRNALVFLDVQVGHSTLREELPRLTPFLSRPHFHLGIDPEFSMKDGTAPGKKIGTFDAADVNYAAGFLAELVTQRSLPPKVLVVHRFTQRGVTNSKRIQLDPRVQIVMDMDGFGPPHLKKNTFRKWIKAEPVQFVGWKQFYKPRNDSPRTTIAQILSLHPRPNYIQYQ
jgi:hypothetical protein